MKERIKNILKIFLIAFWMIVVFNLSGEVGEDSSSLSQVFTKSCIELFYNGDNIESVVEILEPIMRKLAHFGLYAIGGFFIYSYIKDKISMPGKCIAFSFMFGVIYAITDEIHQFFVSGRDSRVMDVFIDGAGVIVGIFICVLFYKLISKLKRNNLNNINSN